MLGFPIRTPPDHSSVANSPGLIAGSNVLHRLLMPRHPPCALHSLSQQRQNNTRCTHTRSTGARNKTTRTPDPPHNQGMSRTAFIDTTHKESRRHRQHNYTLATHPPPRPQQGQASGHITKMLASTMQISNNNPTNTLNHPPAASSKGRNRSPTTHHHLN